MFKYPSVEKIIEFNLLSLNIIRVKKADSSKVLSRTKIEQALKACSKFEGDIFDKAVVLLIGLVRAHAFASGNRRTAFISMKYFLEINNKKSGIKDSPESAKVFLGVRESYYSHREIKEWIRNGQIREFKR